MQALGDLYAEFASLLADGSPCALVVLTEVRGSTPQEAGAKMLVTQRGWHSGTVGGGRVEAAAVRHAVAMLSEPGQPRHQVLRWNLQRDIGMTCGGEMTLYFEAHVPSAWTVVLFGAGHVAQALVRVLQPLPCQITCYDTRSEWLDRLPRAPNLRAERLDVLSSAVKCLPKHAFVIVMTQGHATDLPILREILTTQSFPFVGVIGSAAKRAALVRELRDACVPEDVREKFVCPIGLPIGGNHPHEIALSIAAQILEQRDEKFGVRA